MGTVEKIVMNESLDYIFQLKNNAKELTDKQLYSLVSFNQLPQQLSEPIKQEFEHRNFSPSHLDALNLEYEKNQPIKEQIDIRISEKLLIIFLPFITTIHAVIANRHFKRRDHYKWNQHWKFIALGYLLWFSIVISLVII